MSGQRLCEMHVCLRQLLRLCHWAGFFPVEGLDEENISKLRFNMRSPYVIYYFTTLFGQILLACLSTYFFIINDLNLDNLTNLTFYVTGLIAAFFLLKLARHWPKVIERAYNIESCVSCIQLKPKQSLWYSRIARLVMILALLEHIASVTFKANLVMNCHQDFILSPSLVKKYFTTTMPYIFKFTTYTHWKAVMFEIANIQSTFIWNFTDAMTICVSLYLVSYFQNLNNIIEHRKVGEVIHWEDIRIQYSHLVKLVQTVDFNMCYLILLSFFTNLFFICVQLFYLMNNYPVLVDCNHDHVKLSFDSLEHYIYYSYSFLFLFIRATATSLLAANVNTVARQPIFTLLHVPESEYTIEVQRFIRQIRYTTTAISGLLFDVTRETILTIIGAVIKYELVLLQFSYKKYDAIH